MEFKSQDEAWEYWQNCWYESGKGYEGLGVTLSDQVDMFKEWLEEECIGWPDSKGNQNLQD